MQRKLTSLYPLVVDAAVLPASETFRHWL